MQLYFISDKGYLIKINKYDFLEDEVYIVDDWKTLYIWHGLNASQEKKDVALKHARRLVSERVSGTKILLLKQNDEYGAFLAMMEDLKIGINIDGTLKTRPELDLEEIIKSPEKDYGLESMIRVAAYYLSQEHFTYDELCWLLAEKQLIIQTGEMDIEEELIRKKAEEIFKSSTTYDELCWIIAELDILVDKKYIT